MHVEGDEDDVGLFLSSFERCSVTMRASPQSGGMHSIKQTGFSGVPVLALAALLLLIDPVLACLELVDILEGHTSPHPQPGPL